jgi:hypothetical protein
MEVSIEGEDCFGDKEKFVFQCEQVVDGIAVNPKLGVSFDDTPNDARSDRQRAWWDRPYIETETGTGPEWLKAWPSGMRYDVRCLDGGAWDRSTCWGMAATLEEAVRIAKTGPTWRRGEMQEALKREHL